MKKIVLRHTINCSEDKFWEIFFDEAYNRGMYIDDLQFPEYKQVSFDKTDSKYNRVVQGKPKMNAPKAVQKVLGDSFSYQEIGEYDVKSRVWTWRIKPSVLDGKLLTTGVVRVEPIDENSCTRVAEITCEAKIFGVGGMLESTMEKEMHTGWSKSAAFTNAWIKKLGS